MLLRLHGMFGQWHIRSFLLLPNFTYRSLPPLPLLSLPLFLLPLHSQANALRELKQAVGEPSSLESWSGRNPCSSSSPWTGVKCDVAPPESLPESATSAGLQYSYISSL